MKLLDDNVYVEDAAAGAYIGCCAVEIEPIRGFSAIIDEGKTVLYYQGARCKLIKKSKRAATYRTPIGDVGFEARILVPRGEPGGRNARWFLVAHDHLRAGHIERVLRSGKGDDGVYESGCVLEYWLDKNNVVWETDRVTVKCHLREQGARQLQEEDALQRIGDGAKRERFIGVPWAENQGNKAGQALNDDDETDEDEDEDDNPYGPYALDEE